MNLSFKYFFGICVLFLTYSCEKEVKTFSPENKKLQIINSLQCFDSVAKCFITNINDVNTININPITNAFVLLYDETETVIDTLKHLNNGLYKGNIKLNKVGIPYHIKSIVNLLPNINCYFKFPVKPNFEVADFKYIGLPLGTSSHNYNGTNVTITLNDLGTPNDVYSINVLMLDSFFKSGGYIKNYREYAFYSDEPSIKSPEIQDFQFDNGRLFDDYLFNGTSRVINLNVYTDNRIGVNTFTFFIVVKTYSSEYFKYYKDYDTQLIAQQNSGIGLNYLYNLYPYKAVYSNIEGGAGIYGCYNYAVITAKVTR